MPGWRGSSRHCRGQDRQPSAIIHSEEHICLAHHLAFIGNKLEQRESKLSALSLSIRNADAHPLVTQEGSGVAGGSPPTPAHRPCPCHFDPGCSRDRRSPSSPAPLLPLSAAARHGTRVEPWAGGPPDRPGRCLQALRGIHQKNLIGRQTHPRLGVDAEAIARKAMERAGQQREQQQRRQPEDAPGERPRISGCATRVPEERAPSLGKAAQGVACRTSRSDSVRPAGAASTAGRSNTRSPRPARRSAVVR